MTIVSSAGFGFGAFGYKFYCLFWFNISISRLRISSHDIRSLCVTMIH